MAIEDYLELHTSEEVSALNFYSSDKLQASCSRREKSNNQLISSNIICIGKNINYDGDIDDEEEILDWLTLPDNMEMTDHIEEVNRKMFQKIRQTSDYLAVFFCNYFF